MKHTNKMIISVLMAAITAFSFIGTTMADTVCNYPPYRVKQFTDGAFVYQIEADGAVVTAINGEIKGDMIIPEKLGGYEVTELAEFLFFDNKLITSVTIPDSVVEIGISAFRGCTSLKNVKLPNNLKRLHSCAFENCSDLEEIVVPESLTVIEDSTFKNCTSLNKLDLHEGVEFIYDNALDNTGIVNNEKNREYGILYLEHILFNAKDSVSGVITVKEGTTCINQRAFANNKKITEVIIPEGVKIIENHAFSGCTALEKASLPSTLTKIGQYAFYGTKLKAVTIPDGVKELYAGEFAECKELTDITIPEGIEMLSQSAFSKTPYLENIYKNNGGAFYFGDMLVCVSPDISGEFSVKNGTKTICPQAFDLCKNITVLSLPDSTECMKPGAISGLSSVKEISIPDKVTEIRTVDFNHSLEVLNIGKGVTDIRFDAVLFVKKINIHKDNPAYSSEGLVVFNKDKTILYRNYDFTSVNEYVVPASVKEIGKQAFAGSKYKNIRLHSGVTKIGAEAFIWSAADNADNYIDGSFYLGDCLIKGKGEICKVKDGTRLIADYAFYDSSTVKEIYIPESVKYIGEMICARSSNIEKITVMSPYVSYCDCSLFDSNCVIYGYSGSTTEMHADRLGLTFASIGQTETLINNSDVLKVRGITCIVLPGTTVNDIIKSAERKAVIVDSKGNTVTGNTVVATGMEVVISDVSAHFYVVVLGDVDENGTISAADARLSLRASVGLECYSESSVRYQAANVLSKDGISAADAREILRASVGLADSSSWL